MNIRKTSPQGIDLVIDEIQRKIYDGLLQRWSSVNIYGRVYSNLRVLEDGTEEYVLERYLGNGEYEPILTNDENRIFFIQGNNVEISYTNAQNDLWLVCIFNVGSLSTEYRADEEAHVHLVTELGKAVPYSTIQEVRYGVQNFREITDDTFGQSNFKFSDIQPNHIFMVRIAASYSLIENNC